MIETYKNAYGVDCVSGTNEDGSGWSMLKSAYDEAQAEQSTPIVESSV